MVPHPIQASAAMLVKNSERYLAEVLTALADFDEVLLLDNGSTDSTVQIAAQFPNVRICKHEFIGFGPMKNLAASLAKNDWIFSIDSDEVADQELIESIHHALLNNNEETVYTLSRLNHFHGKLIKSCGWYPDIIPRLYHKKHAAFSDRQVHEALAIPAGSKIQALSGHLKHYSYNSVEELINKMQLYSSLYAEQNQFKKKASPTIALWHGGFSFLKNYFIKHGFTDGADGLIISSVNSQGSYYKYIKLFEHNRNLTVSLIITTYNRPDALALVLKSALQQTHLPSEIIVADDGSTKETAQIINEIAQQNPIQIKHIWQEDKGFRAAEARNRAIAAAQSDYLIIIDGDMILEKSFISDHLKVALKGRLIQGSRALLKQSFTKKVLHNPDLSAFLKDKKSIENYWSAWRLPCLSGLINRFGNRKHKSIKSCNMGFFRSDALKVNGFNNEFVGWGREDSEFVARLYHSGIKRHNLKFSGIAYHLWHPEAERAALPANDALLQRTLNEKKIRCENGVEQFINH